MNTPQWLRSDVTYIRHLTEAGVDGITSVWNAPRDRTIAWDARNAAWLTAVGGLVGELALS